MTTINMTVNGKAVSGDVEDRTLLVSFIRENLRLTGTHVGCDTSQCGACVIMVNGTFSRNIAGGSGGGMYNVFCDLDMTNTIMWDDSASTAPEIAT